MLASLLLSFLPFATTPLESWRTEIVFQAPDKLGACAVGDVDPSRPGLEIVTACRNGDLYMVFRREGSWQIEKIGTTPGEMIQLAVGDVHPDRPGDEIVAVGSAEGPEVDNDPGAAWIFQREDEGWSSEHLYKSAKLLHAVTTGSSCIYVAGYDMHVIEIHWFDKTRPGPWINVFAKLPGAAKCAVTWRGTGFFACTDGTVAWVTVDVDDSYPSPQGEAQPLYHSHPFNKRPSGRARMGTDGERLVVCDDDGTLSLIDAEGNGQVVYKENDKLRGAVLADLDPARPGPEIATVGYERRLTILTLEGDVWQPTPVLIETDKFHGLTSGDLDGDGDHELVACGYSGRLILVDRNRR